MHEYTSSETKARLAISLMDLTCLNEDDSEQDIRTLCARASGPIASVAAVCVSPRFVSLARSLLPQAIGVATVVNFPCGNADAALAVAETRAVIEAGAHEIDVVLPYHAMREGRLEDVRHFLGSVRDACPERVLKIILETGELEHPELIARASDLSIDAGANFLKTSTGKTPVSATPAASCVMLHRIAARGDAGGQVGFKASGGVRTLDDAAVYLALQAEILGKDSLTPKRFRIGASSLLDNLEAAVGHGAVIIDSTGY
ncbi:deoxyribose-phosphate aldolase [Ensifer adhaerens]|uniref:deoxyribose-phosphate aldolase n=1 Tax=Ensifer adhaerens TaxID=106592 RepID=UPI001CBD5E86|nr:deoxyribose-phosphate aldolase [Ensifer adhaerens]MBZ7924910.1 deoxyribose-phosphate aldolase [Ensifer adhaerens]UAX95876.1 deoxyribose-phosphate aldolase [Ensifer adhaerens]UAY04782.1 deoxyribose-phosphate aldolase [Ensifer adhaerens]UAY10213.1 deoxyribose-phosphate aldolase [Ensifer adhaerens]